MAKWCKLDQCKMTIMEALMKLDQIIDESDPDVSSTPQHDFLVTIVIGINSNDTRYVPQTNMIMCLVCIYMYTLHYMRTL